MSKKQRSTRKPKPRLTPQPEPQSIPMHERQYALIGDTLLDVGYAHRLLRANPRHTVLIDVETWARLYGLDGNPNSPIKIGPLFDPVHAKSADLTRPILLATFVSGPTPDQDLLLIIDGSHRLYRAFTERQEVLPAVILTAAETRAITHTPQFGAPSCPQFPKARTTGAQQP